ncbi:MAG: hypothetical protein FWD13_10160 [Treponema sp.]|nr:hypothetical protein [Treponema sp.]
MRHLFIINPVAKRINGNVKKIKDKLSVFFCEYPDIHYDIFESRWCRDSLTFIRRYISGTNETVRIHSIGGNGTLFEVVNSIVGLTNVEVAAYPYGSANAFLRYFGLKNEKYFFSIKNQVFDKTIPLDIIRCGNNYGAGFAIAGLEAYTNMKGDEWIAKGMPEDAAYVLAAITKIMSNKPRQKYFIEIDGNKIDEDFFSVLVANTPCYGKSLSPGSDAHPDDGILDVYLLKSLSKLKLLSGIQFYTRGEYRKKPGLVSYYKANKIKLSSDEVMCMGIDGQTMYGTSIEYEILPKAINLVCPGEVDILKLPRIYGKPKEGLRT